MNTFKVAGKYLDQPLLVAKFQKVVPMGLLAAGTGYTIHEVNKENHDKKLCGVRVGTTMLCTVTSALAAPILTNKMFKINPRTIKNIKYDNSKLVDEFVSKTQLDDKAKVIVEKSKDKVLNFKDVKFLCKEFKDGEKKEFLNKLIPEPENISSKEIFSEIGRLSILGLIPVIGGIFGGIWGDKMSNSDWKNNIPNKIKEGTYQYLANIFLCNVGAGIALGLMEKSNIKSKSHRALGMVGGIVSTGVVGGSVIANIIGGKLINPMFGESKPDNLYSERKPEALDIGLHVDDIATVAVMSGLKWIEPALPVMYSISGYRAGVGYRNGAHSTKDKLQKVDKNL